MERCDTDSRSPEMPSTITSKMFNHNRWRKIRYSMIKSNLNNDYVQILAYKKVFEAEH